MLEDRLGRVSMVREPEVGFHPATAIIMVVAVIASLTAPQALSAGMPGERWGGARANRWYEEQPWPCGFNYVPANSISYTEMWMGYASDTPMGRLTFHDVVSPAVADVQCARKGRDRARQGAGHGHPAGRR